MLYKNKLVVNSFFYTIGEIIPKILSFILLPVLTRYLSPAEYAINNYTSTIMGFLLVLSVLSLNTFLLRNYYKTSTDVERKKLVGSIFILTIIVNLFFSAISFAIFPSAIKLFKINIPFYPYFFLAIIINALDGVTIIPMVLYRVREQAKIFVTINVSKTFFQLIITYILLRYYNWGLVSVYISRLTISLIYSFFFIRIVSRASIFKFNLSQVKSALRFSFPLLPGALSYLFITSFDRIILERNVSLTELGIYSTAATLALTLNIIVQGLYRSFEQKIFQQHGQQGYQKLVLNLGNLFFFMVIAGGILISCFCKEFFLLFTSHKYVEAYKSVPYQVVPVVIAGINVFLSTILVADNKQIYITKGTVMSLVISVLIALILIPAFKIPGAIISSIIAFLIVQIYYSINVGLNKKLLFKQMAILIIPAIALIINHYELDTIFKNLLFKSIIATITIGFLFYLFKIPTIIKSKILTEITKGT
ncbi:lipopolysaccharide biosynthesis protein [Chitinophagaceae bacterium LWZ2-11]